MILFMISVTMTSRITLENNSNGDSGDNNDSDYIDISDVMMT